MGGGGKGGGGSSASSTVTVTSTDTVDVVGLDDVNATLELKLPQPLETSNTTTLELKPVEIKPLTATLDDKTHLTVDPLKVDASLTLDVKPAVVDVCLTTNVGKLPNVCMRQPYHHHVGITWFGVEWLGFTFSGEQQTVIEELDRQPKVAWGGATPSWPPRDAPAERDGPPSRHAGGLRIRLGT